MTSAFTKAPVRFVPNNGVWISNVFMYGVLIAKGINRIPPRSYFLVVTCYQSSMEFHTTTTSPMKEDITWQHQPICMR